MSGEIHLKADLAPSSRTKAVPKELSTPFFYAPSDDGTDENLLVFLHGLGDTHLPFAKLGRQLKLPQTAVLALQAPEKIPFLYEEAYQWYTSFDPLGELIERPNPSAAIDLLSDVLKHLIEVCSWPSDKIHLFGFAQGGTVALELAIQFWKNQINAKSSKSSSLSLGSIVTISGPLLSYPTLPTPSPTPILAVYRPPPADPSLSGGDLTALKKGFNTVKEVKLQSRGPGMPSSKDEWEPIMRFWSERLSRRQVDGVYEVMSGLGPR
ncbi:hypothetical protein BT96DRAFT_1015502 [Gymnopus androsaceus JB14]|uniref:Phospholipase/carboxylesterase/thioesterase domain-containing protein n=1 Tax=Gymnopus androsaceus JB14 TaxID=1447944 RepID=A0A6A4I4R6_9AGAR|nr:hypothetical protein BT96DRAFT_1015502 [Gymnopus androsaceus JB14]